MLKLAKKLVFTFIYFVFFLFSVFTQELSKPQPENAPWRYLQNAQLAYDRGAFDECVVECQKATENRTKEVEYESAMLEKSLKVVEVIKAGDLIKDVIPVLQERKNNQTIDVIQKYTDIYGSDFQDGSITKLLAYIKRKKNYPEVDYLLSKVYFAEGENSLCMQYLFSAYDNADILEIPDEKYDILYSMADMAYINDDIENYEKYLTLIISNDTLFWDSGLALAMLRTIDSNTQNSSEKFFTLYRAKNNRSLKAYEMLSQVYESLGKQEEALKAIAFAALTSYSQIFEVTKQRNINFFYSDVASLFKEAAQYDDVVQWAGDNDVWECFYLLAQYAKRRGCDVFAKQLFDIIAKSFPQEYWQQKAKNQLSGL